MKTEIEAPGGTIEMWIDDIGPFIAARFNPDGGGPGFEVRMNPHEAHEMHAALGMYLEELERVG